MDALDSARRHGLGRIVNSSVLGAFVRATGWVTLEQVDQVLKGMKRAEANVAADGMPLETAEAIAWHHLQQGETVSPLPLFTPLATNSRFRIGRSEYDLIWVPGHSDGLAVFWDAQTGICLPMMPF